MRQGKKNTHSPFKPKRNQIDFTHARYAPVINCVLRYKNKLLVVKRSHTLNFYPGYWNGISGFLDDQKTLIEKVAEELEEELGMQKDKIAQIRMGPIFHQNEPRYKKTWIVHPVLVNVKTDVIKLDWEAKEARWLTRRDIHKLKLLPGFGTVLKNLPWIKK